METHSVPWDPSSHTLCEFPGRVPILIGLVLEVRSRSSCTPAPLQAPSTLSLGWLWASLLKRSDLRFFPGEKEKLSYLTVLFYRSLAMDRKHLTRDLTHHHGRHVCVISPKVACWNPHPCDWMVLGGGAFRFRWDLENGAPGIECISL